uniref:Uncharacterized protein n=2 Tax=Oryza TaxID=4527 RepID=A0A0E0BJE5_9ORYZ
MPFLGETKSSARRFPIGPNIINQEQLKPLITQLDSVTDLPFPDIGSIQDWVRATLGASANGAVCSSQNSEGERRYSSIPMPFLGETKKRQEEEAKRRIQEEIIGCIYDAQVWSKGQFGAKSKRGDGGESGDDDGIELEALQPIGIFLKVFNTSTKFYP